MFERPVSERGSTLIELILMIIIGIVALFPLLAMYSNATMNSVEPDLITQAAFLAQEQIERILSDYKSPSRGYDYIVDANYPPVSDPTGFLGFTISVSVSSDSTYDSVSFKTVVVTVARSGIANLDLATWVTQ